MCIRDSLTTALKKLISLRQGNSVLKQGSYSQIAVSNTSLVFKREYKGETLIVAVNGSSQPIKVRLPSDLLGKKFLDILNPESEPTVPGLEMEVELFTRLARVFSVQ